MARRIYVAEDSPLQLDLMRAALEPEDDMEAEFFSDGLELYRRVLAEPPQMLILDIIMPSLSGLAITRLLKFHDQYRHIPILVVSSIIDPDIRDRVLGAGANEFLPKPYDVPNLLDIIDGLLPASEAA